MKTFEAVVPHQAPGATYPLLGHPAQTFRWADYTAKPAHDYVYEVVPMRGSAKYLEQGKAVFVEVSTETEGEGGAVHDVYFNRGVAGSQAYARRFENVKPTELPPEQAREAYAWLSRGLEEALLAFLAAARGERWGLRAAVYEFDHDPVLQAFKEAHERGADVKIVYDARKAHPRDATVKVLKRNGIKSLATPRETGSAISHNKFIVLLHDGDPVAVWTGSTNITKSGFYGQSNVGHVVRDPGVARAYLEYWEQLRTDPAYAPLRTWTQGNTADPAGAPPRGTTVLFSPREGLGVLEWYASRLDSAQSSAHMSAAFGVHDLFEAVLGKQMAHPRYVLLEKADEDQAEWTRDRDVMAAVGAKIEDDALYGWLGEELAGFGMHVRYVHDKFMLVDPLSNAPLVITGSANFSEASTKVNDENMLVIRGDTRVADIYLGEFMRLFSHHYFRDLIRKQQGTGGDHLKTAYLEPTDRWTSRYFKPGSVKSKERRLFSGASS
jgi:phosphatidylserine/phosphatidylglycerophosphate/cardiolipin synthase-like enzyme